MDCLDAASDIFTSSVPAFALHDSNINRQARLRIGYDTIKGLRQWCGVAGPVPSEGVIVRSGRVRLSLTPGFNENISISNTSFGGQPVYGALVNPPELQSASTVVSDADQDKTASRIQLPRSETSTPIFGTMLIPPVFNTSKVSSTGGNITDDDDDKPDAVPDTK